MMAAAMTTRKSRAPTYVDLAKASAVVKRDLPPAACARLQAVVEDLGAVHAELRFTLDAEHRVRVGGSVETTVALECQLCAEPVSKPLRAEFDGLLAPTEAQASAWRAAGGSDNIIVVESAELDAAALVEDELLLQLPTKVCVESACERRPVMSYGPPGEPVEADTYNPFAALSELKADLKVDKQS